MRVRLVNRAGEISAELWERCFAPPVEGRWWYEALENAGIEDQFAFNYAVLERDGKDVGIAPIFRMDVPIDLVAPPVIAKLLRAAGAIVPRLRYQRTIFVGSPCGEEGTIGLLPGVSMDEAVAALQPELERMAREHRASMIVYKDFPEEYAGTFSPTLGAKRLFSAPSYPGTRIALGVKDFEGYLKSLKGSHRHNLKKKLKKSRAQGTLESSIVQHPDAATMDEIFALFWQTYEHGKTKFEKLTRKFFDEIDKPASSHFVLLRDVATKKLVAFMLCFDVRPRMINKFIGIDYSYGGDWYLYFRLWEAAVNFAIKRGAGEFQSGQTGYRAKLDVGHSLVPLNNYCRHTNPLLHRVFARVARTITWETLDEDLATFLASQRGTSASAGSESGPDASGEPSKVEVSVARGGSDGASPSETRAAASSHRG